MPRVYGRRTSRVYLEFVVISSLLRPIPKNVVNEQYTRVQPIDTMRNHHHSDKKLGGSGVLGGEEFY